MAPVASCAKRLCCLDNQASIAKTKSRELRFVAAPASRRVMRREETAIGERMTCHDDRIVPLTRPPLISSFDRFAVLVSLTWNHVRDTPNSL